MNGQQLRKLREQQGWSRKQLAEMLSQALGRNVHPDRSIGRWERDERGVPRDVDVFLTELGLGSILPPSDPEPEQEPGPGDTPPDGPDVKQQPPPRQTLLSKSSPYEEVCTQLWEIVAAGVGMVGAATGSEALRKDGEIIEAEKEKLGRAYAHLADTNATFRNMIGSMSTSGAWAEVGFVTGTLVSKLYKNHQETRIISGTVAPRDGDEPETGFPVAA